MGKNSFVLYDEYGEHIEFLTDQQTGILIKAIFAYRNGKELPEMDSAVNVAFSFIRSKIDSDQERYADICKLRRAAGQAGAVKRWQNIANGSKCQENIANGSKCQENIANGRKTIAKIADNEYDNDNEYEYEYEYNNNLQENNNSLVNKQSTLKEKNREKKKKMPQSDILGHIEGENEIEQQEGTPEKANKRKKFIPPTLEEVEAYAAERGRSDLAKPFYEYFTAGAWHDVNGTPVRSWKQKFITWENHNPVRSPNGAAAHTKDQSVTFLRELYEEYSAGEIYGDGDGEGGIYGA